jgi:hypothetical protein
MPLEVSAPGLAGLPAPLPHRLRALTAWPAARQPLWTAAARRGRPLSTGIPKTASPSVASDAMTVTSPLAFDVSPDDVRRLAESVEAIATALSGELAASYFTSVPAGPSGPTGAVGALDDWLIAADRSLSASAAAFRDWAARARTATRAYEAADGWTSW